MRLDQYQRLQELDELLVEVFLDEANPNTWPGAGKSAADQTKQERGDRFWSKRNVIGTGAVLRSVYDLVDRHENNTSADPATQAQRDNDLDKHINRYEAEAAKLLKKVQEAGQR